MTHMNSRASFHAGTKEMGDRRAAVYATLRRFGKMTDRQVKEALGLPDMNGVRPRITELVADGWAEECGVITDPITDRSVRVVRAISPDEHARRDGSAVDAMLDLI